MAKKILVEYIHPDTGPEVDTFDGEHVSFMTEPSGALVVFKKQPAVWAAFGPGSWWKVMTVDG